jgi:DNA-nicking Smr family endonuclease
MSKRTSKGRPELSDWHLWTEVKRSVRPLRREVPGPAEQSLPVPASRPPPVFVKGAPWIGPALPAYQPSAGPGLRTEPGRVIEPRLRRRLTRGQLEIDATIDLHGMRQGEARAALQRFLLARLDRGDRTLLVITGKGLQSRDGDRIERGVLRSMLPFWLAEATLAPFVAGWDIAARHHGGEGAYYVRLRRAR